jgi:hypothetical protein
MKKNPAMQVIGVIVFLIGLELALDERSGGNSHDLTPLFLVASPIIVIACR